MTNLPLRVLRPALLGALTTALSAQMTWTSVYTCCPEALEGAMAYDRVGGRVLRHGGRALMAVWSPQNLTNLWDGSAWVTVAFGPHRYGHAMVTDTHRDRIVLFGGFDGNGDSGETWEWDGSAWSLVAAAGPQPRRYASMAYDALRQRVVLFGGLDSQRMALSDTWEWDGQQWRKRLPQTSPSFTARHAMAYDPSRGRTVLYGERQTWEWDGVDWSQRLTPTRPALAYTGIAMAFDTARQRMIIGQASGAPPGYRFSVWEWVDGDWVPGVLSPGSSIGRDLGLAYDERRRQMVGTSDSAMTMQYLPVNPANYSSFGAGCGGTAGTPTLQPAPRALPWIGEEFRLRLGQLPAAQPGVLWLGASNRQWGPLSLPLAMQRFGFSGCALLVSPDVGVPWFSGAGSVNLALPIPSVASLAGAELHVQAMVVDPSGIGGLGASAGGTVLLGAK